MILDEYLEFCDNEDISGSAGNAVAGDVIDLGAASRDIGNGQPVYLILQTGDTEIITGGTAGTMTFTLESDSAADLATSATTHWTSEAMVTDDAGANDSRFNAGGTIAVITLPVEDRYERYLGIRVTIATTTVTAGTLNAFLTLDPTGWKSYPDAVNSP